MCRSQQADHGQIEAIMENVGIYHRDLMEDTKKEWEKKIETNKERKRENGLVEN